MKKISSLKQRLSRLPATQRPIFHRLERGADGRIGSLQCLTLPAQGSPPAGTLGGWLRRLGPLYVARLQRLSLGLIRPMQEAGGSRFTLAGVGWTLLRFTPPRLEGGAAGGAAHFPIVGGLMVQPGSEGRGSLILSLAAQPDGRLRLCMEVRDYQPRLPWPLYRWTQAPLHHAIARDFLRHLARTLAAGGGRPPA